jgi:hypothetical protein
MADRGSTGHAVGLLTPTRWAPNGFAAIPTTALDPPHSAASPAVPALSGPGPHQSLSSHQNILHESGSSRLPFNQLLKFGQDVVVMQRKIPDHPGICEKLPDVSVGQHKIEMIGAV